MERSKGISGDSVARDGGARLFHLHLGFEGRKLLQGLPSVIEGLALPSFEPATRIQSGAASAPALDVDPEAGVGDQGVGNVWRIGRRECGLPCKGLLVHR